MDAVTNALQERMDQLENKMTNKLDMVLKILEGPPARVTLQKSSSTRPGVQVHFFSH